MRSARIFLTAALALVACGGPQPPPRDIDPGFNVPRVECPGGGSAPTRTLCPELDAGGPAAMDAGATALATNSYPPPKPTTISLASTGDPKVDAALKAGDDAFEANDVDGALKRYEEARVLAPKKSAPMIGIDRAKIAKANVPYDFASAKGNAEISAVSSDLKKAVKMEPSLGAAQVELGRALLLLGDAAGAIDALKKGAQLLPNEAEAHSALGVAWLATGHPEEAMQEMGAAAKLDPGSAARHENYGTTLLMRGKTAEAITEYRASIAIDPNDARSHSDLGTALLGDNQVVAAIPELEKAISLDPKRATFYSNLGYALQTEGKLAEAEKQYQAALNIDPQLASAWINLATLLAKDPKRRADARKALEKARAIDPTDPRVKANLEELDSLH